MHLIVKNASFIFKKINIQFYYYIQKQKKITQRIISNSLEYLLMIKMIISELI